MLRTTLHAVLLGGFIMSATPTLAQTTTELDPQAGFLERVEYHIGQNPSLPRFLLNECVLAGVAAAIVAVTISGPATPVVEAALGVVPGMSVLSITGLACGAGMAAGVAAAGFATAWEERQQIQEAAVTQVAWIWNGVTTSERLPGGWSIAALWERAAEVTQVAMQTIGSATSTVIVFREVPAPVEDKPVGFELAALTR